MVKPGESPKQAAVRKVKNAKKRQRQNDRLFGPKTAPEVEHIRRGLTTNKRELGMRPPPRRRIQ